MRVFQQFFLVTALATAALPVLASGSASASLDQLTIQVIDLNSGDGVAPGVAFPDNFGGSMVRVEAVQVPWGPGVLEYRMNDLQWGDVSFGATVQFAQSSASLSGAAVDGTDAKLVAQGSTTYSGIDGFQAHFDALALNGGRGFFSLTVLPHTQVVLSGIAVVQASSTTQPNQAFDNSDLMLAQAGFKLEQNFSTIALDEASIQCETTASNSFCSLSDTRRVTVSFSNTSDTNVNALLSTYAYVWGDTTAAVPIPEPGTWVSMAVGLGALGLCSRRNRKHRQGC